jgi:prephenate dehydratase
MKVVEGADTAESAKEIKERKLKGQAAIASRLAADIYGLEVLASGIQSNQRNMTRFLAICRQEDYSPTPSANKSSLRFEAPDKPGSLVKILESLDDYGINMTKLQSVVIPDRPYEYGFHVDLEWSDRAKYYQALSELNKRANQIIYFGDYVRGERKWD